MSQQNGMKKYLQDKTLKSIVEKESFDTSEALKNLCETIARYAPLGSVSFRNEKAKAECLFIAVAGFEWANIPLTQFYSDEPSWKLHRLFTAMGTS